jgi:hypothetical protein
MDTFDHIYLNDFGNEDGFDGDEQQNAFNVNSLFIPLVFHNLLFSY